ncbi:GvpL/GvpF family gas vesicle protein [Streptomyces sp. NPDC051079]|uniref:GvpL/GvpF family gas vesicle protein n=1 Tax=Streptomyces sp. NPDC051079 TaxID=3155043 RepID=UPI00344DAE61
MNAAPAATLTYVYGVTPPAPGLDDVLSTLTGVAGCRVALIGAAPDAAGPPLVAFAVSDVPRAEFAEEVLPERFEDLRWLEATARAHHLVIEALAARTTVLPLRMATLYQDRSRAVRALGAQSPQFAARLAQLAAHTEYGVKIYVRGRAAGPDPDPAPEPAVERDGATGPSAGPGRAYLRARRAQRDADEDHHRQARIAADRVAAIARRHSARHVSHPPQSGPLAETGAEAAAGAGENVVNDAFLVPDAAAGAFRAAVRAAAADLPGVLLELNGPWAPYSFTAPPPPPEPPPPGRGPVS